MKLEEAAALMGVSLDNITPELLKQTYKKLALSWDPQQVDRTVTVVVLLALVVVIRVIIITLVVIVKVAALELFNDILVR